MTALRRDNSEQPRLLECHPRPLSAGRRAGRSHRAVKTVHCSYWERWVRVAENTCSPRPAARSFLKQWGQRSPDRLRSGRHWPECVSRYMSESQSAPRRAVERPLGSQMAKRQRLYLRGVHKTRERCARDAASRIVRLRVATPNNMQPSYLTRHQLHAIAVEGAFPGATLPSP
jgi:hypothetical protein